MSNYGVGPYGFLLTVADIGSVVATLALVCWPLSRHRRHLLGLTWGSFSLASLASPSCWLGFFRSMSAQKLRRPAPSITSPAIYRSFVSLSQRSSCLCAWVRTSNGDLFGVPRLRCQLWSILTVILTIVGANLGIAYGVAQRVANVAVVVWMFVVALHLRSVAQGALIQQPSRAS